MNDDAYRAPLPARCAACGAPTDPSNAFLSSRGPVCAACHRRDAQTVCEHERERTTGGDAMMNGVFALGAAAMIAVVAFFTPAGMVPGRIFGICGLSMVALAACALRSWRFGTGGRHGMTARVVVGVGVGVGAISAFEIVRRLVG